MKKALRGIVIAVILVAMIATMTACNHYKWDAVGTTEYSSQEAVNNGSLYVQQGKYVYFVNGSYENSSLTKDDNEWGSVSVKGSIMKASVNDDGSLKVLGVVVPKLFLSSYSGAGIYVYGDWIYYVSRSLKTDNKGSLISAVEFMRTKTDGTKTQSIALVEDISSTFVYTSKGLIYTYDSDIYFKGYNADKVNKDADKIVDDYSAVVASNTDQCIFYTKASSNSLVSANSLGVVTKDGSKKVIISEKAYSSSEEYYTDLDNLFTITVVSYDAKSDTLVYTKKCANSAAKTGTYTYHFSGSFDFDKTKEVKFANSALSSVYVLSDATTSNTLGLVDTSSSTVKVYYPIAEGALDNTSREVTFNAQITILYTTNEYVYFGMGSLLYRVNLFNVDATVVSKPYTDKISEAKYSTPYGNPTNIGNNIYFISSDDSSYLYMVNVAEFAKNEENGAITYANGYIVSGYKAYTYGDDDDFVINKDKGEKLENMVPKYMTSDDLKTYISNHKTDNE